MILTVLEEKEESQSVILDRRFWDLQFSDGTNSSGLVEPEIKYIYLMSNTLLFEIRIKSINQSFPHITVCYTPLNSTFQQ
jgi:hypothetical protein